METIIIILAVKCIQACNYFAFFILNRVAFTCKNNTYCRIIFEFQINLIQCSVYACINNIHNIIFHSVQNNTVILGTTEYIGVPTFGPHGDGPIRLQSHGDASEPISYRNIWIRKL